MKRRSAWLVMAAFICSVISAGSGTAGAGELPAGADRAGFSGSWSDMKRVPGSAVLNGGGDAAVSSVSCPSVGDCVAGGGYTNSSGHGQAFVASELHGVWGKALALKLGGNGGITAVSCASPSNCGAVGDYVDAAGHGQAFVASEVKGDWHAAEEVPGLAALNVGGAAEINSVSCGSPGNCSAGGFYRDSTSSFTYQPFVVTEVNGIWDSVRQLPGMASLNATGVEAGVNSVSCASAGNCSAGGDYTDASFLVQAFVVNEINGVWHDATEVPGTQNLNKGGQADISSVSCASAGNCSAGGNYASNPETAPPPKLQPFVVSEVGGVWGRAEELPGAAGLNSGGIADVDSVSCGSAGACGAGGFYTTASGGAQAFVASEAKGVWRKAEEVPGTAALNTGRSAEISSVSCPSAGECSAGGEYQARSHSEPFVVSDVHGVWGTAKELPGTAAVNTGGLGYLHSLSCAAPGRCGAGGSYSAASSTQAFIATETIVGIYSTFHPPARDTVQDALDKGWSLIANHSALSKGSAGLGNGSTASCPTPFTGNGADQYVEAPVAQYDDKHAVTVPWLSIWTVDAPGKLSSTSAVHVGLTAGKHAAREIAAVEKAYSGRPARPTYVVLDPEGYTCGNYYPPLKCKTKKECQQEYRDKAIPYVWAHLSRRDWDGLVAGWDQGIETVPGLTPAVYLSKDEYTTNTKNGAGFPHVFVAVSFPKKRSSASPGKAIGPNIDGYLAYSTSCATVAADIATVAGWGAEYNTVQFTDSGVDTSPSASAKCQSR